MADVIDRAAVLTEVERFHGHFMYLNEELNLIRELLAVEGASRKRIPEMCSGVKADLRKKTEDLDSFCARCHTGPPRFEGDALVLAETCAPLIAMEIAALDLFVEALTVAEQVGGEDLGFVDEVLGTARSVYNAHVSFVHSALIFQDQELVAFAASYDTDPGIAASREAFDTLTNTEFPQCRAAVRERSAG
jgi:hypothetical protein